MLHLASQYMYLMFSTMRPYPLQILQHSIRNWILAKQKRIIMEGQKMPLVYFRYQPVQDPHPLSDLPTACVYGSAARSWSIIQTHYLQISENKQTRDKLVYSSGSWHQSQSATYISCDKQLRAALNISISL